MSDWTGTLNGLAIGLGTPYLIAGMHGWRTNTALPLGGASSGSSQVPAPKATGNGSWPVPYFMPARDVTLQIDVVATSSTSFAAAVAALEAATVPQGAALPALSLTLDGVTQTVYGTFTARDIPTEFEYQFGLTQATLTLECPDPRRFGDPISAPTGLPSVTGGLLLPATVPWTLTGTQSSGSVSMTNPGNVNGPMTLRIYGPVTAPTVTHVESGAALTLAANLTVSDGDWLDIDCEARTVLYNGQASRNGALTSRGWFAFEPGVNTIGFNASAYNTSAAVQVTGTPAWL